jgi:hypothetical protein
MNTIIVCKDGSRFPAMAPDGRTLSRLPDAGKSRVGQSVSFP